MTRRLDGKIILVTGASRGIGEAIALQFAQEGATLALASRSLEDVERVAVTVNDRGGRALAVRTDVTSDESVAELASTVINQLGQPDVVVNNAGAYVVDHFANIPIEEFQRLIDVNYLGVVRVMQAFLPAMLEAGKGNLLTVASTAGKYGSPFQVPYNASKHAVVGLTRSLGLELASRGVRVNAIAPGFVETPMVSMAKAGFARVLGIPEEDILDTLLQRVPMRRVLQPIEVAQLAVYLASDESIGMTGQTMTISGGLIVA